MVAKAMREITRLPSHIAFIMDGNGRWAQQRGLPRLEGHRAGIENTHSVISYLDKLHIKYVTLYSFSTENWNRPQEEVSGLLAILGESIEKETLELHQHSVRLRHLGRLDRLPKQLKQAINWALKLTKNNNGMTLSLAFDYGGRLEILYRKDFLSREGLILSLTSSFMFTSFPMLAKGLGWSKPIVPESTSIGHT